MISRRQHQHRRRRRRRRSSTLTLLAHSWAWLIMLMFCAPSASGLSYPFREESHWTTWVQTQLDKAAQATDMQAWECSAVPLAHVVTVAGTGHEGYHNGEAHDARFAKPADAAYDARNGFVYVADAANHRVRAISPSGVVTTLAGTGETGSDDGQAPFATFSAPTGVAVLADGSLVVVDRGNHKLRVVKVDSQDAAVVSTLAGVGIAGYSDGHPTERAQFDQPTAVAYDAASDTLYITDTNSHLVRKVASAEKGRDVSTLAGVTNVRQTTCCFPGFVDGAFKDARFDEPTNIHLDDGGGALYVTDVRNRAVRVLHLSSQRVTSFMLDAPLSPPSRLIVPHDVIPFGTPVSHLVVADVAGRRLWNASVATAVPSTVHAYVQVLTAHSIAGSWEAEASHRDGTGDEAAFRNPSRLVRLPDADALSFAKAAVVDADPSALQWRLLVLDDASHAIRMVYAANRPSLLRLTVEGQGTFDGAADGDGVFYKSTSTRHLDLDETGFYSLDGPPLNTSDSFHGHIRYHKESHSVTFCAMPATSYFLTLAGPIVASLVGVDDGHTYLLWSGRTRWDRRDFAFMLRGPGCTSAAAANYNPHATSDDGSCIHPTTLRLLVRQRGLHCAYSVDGPDLFLSDEMSSLADHVDPASGIRLLNLDGTTTQHFDDIHDYVLPLFPAARYAFTFVGTCEARLEMADGSTAPGGRGKVFWDVNADGSAAVDDRTHKVFRTPGPGCTDRQSENFDPAATSDDGSCQDKTVIVVSLTARNWTDHRNAAPSAWYGLGAFVVAQSIADGALYVASPVRIKSTETATKLALRLLPGSYELQYYGNLTGNLRIGEGAAEKRVDITPSLDGVLPAEAMRSVHFEVAGRYDAPTNVGSEGGTVGAPGPQRASIEVPPGSMHVSDDGNVQFRISLWNDTTADARVARQRLRRLHITPHSALFSFAPHHFAFAEPVLLKVPYDASYGRVSTGKDFVFMRASNPTLQDLQAIPGGVFAESSGIAYLMTDRLGIFFVAAKPELWAAELAFDASSIDGSMHTMSLRVIGSSLASFDNAYCAFGNAFSRATFRDDLAQGGHVSCEMPAGQAGFVELSLVNTDLLMLSVGSNPASRAPSAAEPILIEFASPIVLADVNPREVYATGGAIIDIQGRHLHASRNVGGGANVACRFDGLGSSALYLLSSTVGRCVVPAADAGLSTNERMARLRLVKPYAPSSLTSAALLLLDASSPTTTSSNVTGMADGGRTVRVSYEHGLAPHAPRCQFGPISVEVTPEGLTEEPAAFTCRSPALAITSIAVPILLTSANGEAASVVGTFVPIQTGRQGVHVELTRDDGVASVALSFAPFMPQGWSTLKDLRLSSELFVAGRTEHAAIVGFAGVHTTAALTGAVHVRFTFVDDDVQTLLSRDDALLEMPQVFGGYPATLPSDGIVYIWGSNLHAIRECTMRGARRKTNVGTVISMSSSLSACELRGDGDDGGVVSIGVGDELTVRVVTNSFAASLLPGMSQQSWATHGGEVVHATLTRAVAVLEDLPFLSFGSVSVIGMFSSAQDSLIMHTPARAPGWAMVHSSQTLDGVVGTPVLRSIEGANAAPRLLTSQAVPGQLPEGMLRVAIRSTSFPTRAMLAHHFAVNIPPMKGGDGDDAPDIIFAVPAPHLSVGFATIAMHQAQDDQLLYVPAPVLHNVLPSGVPRAFSVAMHVVGSNLYDGSGCIFEGVAGKPSPSRFVSSALVTCDSPSLEPSLNEFSYSITFGLGDAASSSSSKLVLYTFQDVGNALADVPAAVPALDTNTILPFRDEGYVSDVQNHGGLTCHFGTRLVRANALNGTHMICPVPLHHEAPFRVSVF